jgi:hypothetical protein
MYHVYSHVLPISASIIIPDERGNERGEGVEKLFQRNTWKQLSENSPESLSCKYSTQTRLPSQ